MRHDTMVKMIEYFGMFYVSTYFYSKLKKLFMKMIHLKHSSR